MTLETIESKSAGPRWKPISANERRVLGVLVEKAKTTPENYPLSLNALRAGCNQKNNRFPQTQLEESHVEEALDSLRQAGAVLMVQGDSRVDRYRHLAYEWLGVDKVELAVMAELLLRGAQTVGELRGRAARMEPVKDLGELQPILRSLEEKRLITYLSPPGRGATITHTLYLDREMEKVRREAAASAPASDSPTFEEREPTAPTVPAPTPAPARYAAVSVSSSETNGLADEVRRLRSELGDLRRQLESARAEIDATTTQLRDQLDDLNRQLGNA
jgi:uncharacterized protein YceH (UPF0502 family)